MKTYLLCIGVDVADNNYYGGSFSVLNCCEYDAEKFHEHITSNYKIEADTLVTNNLAKSYTILGYLEETSEKLVSGDSLIIYYSGHGTQVNNISADIEDDKGLDEAWCIYDRLLLDDELYHAFSRFKKGVKILGFSDSCHPETMLKFIRRGGSEKSLVVEPEIKYKEKFLDKGEATELFNNNGHKHTNLKVIRESLKKDIDATVVWYGACRDDQTALTGTPNSLFTTNLLEEFISIKKNTTIKQFHDELKTGASKQSYGTDRIPTLRKEGKDSNKELLLSDFLKSNKIELNNKSEIPFYSFSNELVIDLESLDNDDNKQEKINEIKDILINTGFINLDSDEELIDEDLLFIIFNNEYDTPWDAAHIVHSILRNNGFNLYVEPIFDSTNDFHYRFRDNVSQSTTKAITKGEKNINDLSGEFLSKWPHPKDTDNNKFDWYFKDDYTQLETARNDVWDYLIKNKNFPKRQEFENIKTKNDVINIKKKIGNEGIRIAHIDTGYYPNHSSTPWLITGGKSFVKGEKNNEGIEVEDNLLVGEIEYHGMATLGLLAGKKVSKNNTYDGFNDYVGAIPFAEIVPIRIFDSVVLLRPSIKSFIKAVNYAIEMDCEVISMSMAGRASKGMAKAVNRAYRKGITMVTAAGNNFNYAVVDALAPESILYPARYERVIAATGVTYDHTPYDFKAQKKKSFGDLGNRMQGNWGPPSAMKTAIAAYTPNVPSSKMKRDKNGKETYYFIKGGGGTSSATPQIAAAAALWILKNRDELESKSYNGTWKQVEAVKYALFNSANTNKYNKSKKYYGTGILQANEALNKFPKESDLTKAEKASEKRFSSIWKFINLYNPWAKAIKENELTEDDNMRKMMLSEIEQLLNKELEHKDFSEEENITAKDLEKIMDSPDISKTLKNSGFELLN